MRTCQQHPGDGCTLLRIGSPGILSASKVFDQGRGMPAAAGVIRRAGEGGAHTPLHSLYAGMSFEW